MAIQNYIIKNTKFSRIIDVVKYLPQIIERFPNHGGVFYRYKNQYLHPTFDRYYEQPPVPLSNWYNASLHHWINSPMFIDKKPFIIEVSDHPTSAIGYIANEREPGKVLEHLEAIKKVYNDEKCKFILVSCTGMKKLFSYYFPGELDHKIKIIPHPGCLSKNVDWEKRKNSPLKFVCLASDFYLKGVDILLDAWKSVENKSNSKLYLACPNIPERVKKNILIDNSIELVEKAPLSNEEKENILNNSHVTIAPTHIHGGANIIEGIEYGHAIIYFQYHIEVYKEFGTEIKAPYHFYETSGYGKKWSTLSEFLSKIQRDKKAGIFDGMVNQLAESIRFYIDNKSGYIEDGKKVYEYGRNKLSYKYRNQELEKIYEISKNK